MSSFGLSLSRRYFETYGEPMLREQFGDVYDRIAVGLVGEGSECLGFDDEQSRDHDFDMGFCLFLTAEDERAFGFKLERAYAKLPREFEGFSRGYLSPVGGNRRGVLVIEDFYTRFLGTPTVPDAVDWWLSANPATLRTATSGEVWHDPLGTFTETRERLRQGYPEDVRLRKLSDHLLMVEQSGLYNTPRCLARGERGAAALCAAEAVRHAISAIYLLNNTYEPFYKWALRGLRDLPILSECEPLLTRILTEPDPTLDLEFLSVHLTDACREAGLSSSPCHELTKHALAVADHIRDPHLRNLPPLSTI